MKKRIGFTIFWICVIAFVISLPWLIYRSAVDDAGVGDPMVKNGMFSFTLVYEFEGELITVKDRYICEYEGIGWSLDSGGYRKWKGYIQSTGEDTVIVTKNGDYTLGITIGNPEYYMGLAKNYDLARITTIYKKGSDGSSTSCKDGEYGLKIISFEHAPPIENIAS